MDLLELSWIAEFFLLHCQSYVEKIFYLLLNYGGRWVALLNSVFIIGIAVNCVHISGRG